ncbi:unnamed protein product, partial [Chrysoparadoxa australica]
MVKLPGSPQGGGKEGRIQLPPLPAPGALAIWSTGLTLILGYALYQKALLPQPIAGVAGRIFFWPTMPFTLASRWSNYWTLMDDNVYLGAAPLTILGHPQQLAEMGVKGVVNMCLEYTGPQASYAMYGIKQLHLPVLDHTEPDTATLVKAVEYIKKYADRGEKVLVHCKAGHGRSAAAVMAWRLAETGATPRAIQVEMLEKRRVRRKLFKQSDILEFYMSVN